MSARNLIGLSENDEYALTNQFSSRKAHKYDLGGELRRRSKKIAFGTYSFASQGGAVSTIMLVDDALPKNAVVTNIYADVVAAVTSGGSATIQFKAGSTAISDATAYDDNTQTYDGISLFSVALASSATAIKVSAASDLNIAIAGAALTAGKIHVAVEYWVSDT